MKIIKTNETNCFGILTENDGYTSLELTNHILSNGNLFENFELDNTKKYNPVRTEDIHMLAILQKGNTINKNGRIYPTNLLKREDKKYQDIIKQNRSFNEYNHPSESVIDLERVSHRIKRTWWDDNVLWGEIEILTTDGFKEMGICSTVGDKAAHLLLKGMTLGISSRGVGSLKKIQGQNIVQDDFELICYDLVSSPSTPGAYLFKDVKEKNIYKENVDSRILSEEKINIIKKLIL